MTDAARHPAPPHATPRVAPAAHAAVVAALLVLIAFVFAQVRGFGFINFDDPSYVADNPFVHAGLTWRGLAWAFTTFHTGNWHPLTWLSLMADVELFGADAGKHHLVNVALHAANTLLLLGVLSRATDHFWRSALVAALFAVHPLHVESVAWISERKDLLSSFFGLLSLGAYVRYARAPGGTRSAAVAAALALSLLCKPMLVTLPLVLLLLDRWPLGRAEPFVALVREKLPLFALVGVSSVVTFVAQRSGGAVSTLDTIPVAARLANAALSYARYLGKAVWPASLAAVYPHPTITSAGMSAAAVMLACALLVALSAIAAWQWRARPAIAVGWLWFLVTLVPVIGIVQVGMQAMADRYAYLPLVGVFVAVAWAIPDVSAARFRMVAVTAACALAVACAAATARVQTGYWHDSLSLFEHALAVTDDNATALRNLGVAHLERKEYDRGVAALRESLRLVPGDAWAWMDLGIGLVALGDTASANAAFREAYQRRPDDKDVLYNVGLFAAMQGQTEAARGVHARLQQLSPELATKLAERGGLR